MGGHFNRLWPWVSIVVVVVVAGSMTPHASTPMFAVRRALGQGIPADKKTDRTPEPASDADLAAARARLRPTAVIVIVIGVVGMVVLVWLMELKPF